MYKVEWSEQAEKNLEKIDKVKSRKIRDRVEAVLSKNPYKEGKPLKGELKGLWSYRFSKYRVIYKIFQDRLIIEVVEVGHRRNIY